MKARNGGVLKQKITEIHTSEHVSPLFMPESNPQQNSIQSPKPEKDSKQISLTESSANSIYSNLNQELLEDLHVELIDYRAVLENLKAEFVARSSTPGRNRVRRRITFSAPMRWRWLRRRFRTAMLGLR